MDLLVYPFFSLKTTVTGWQKLVFLGTKQELTMKPFKDLCFLGFSYPVIDSHLFRLNSRDSPSGVTFTLL